MKTNTFISSHHSATSSINKRGGSQNDRTQIRVLAFLKSIFVILLAASCLTMFNSTVSADRNPDITYTLDLNSLGRTNSVRVNMKISVDPKEKLVQVQMPVWSPGDYHVQNHAQYIMGLTAEGTDIMEIPTGGPIASALLPIEINHINSNTWSIKTHSFLTLNISYTLKTTPPGIFSENVKISKNYAFFNGPSTFMYVVGRKQQPIKFKISCESDWQIESPLASKGIESFWGNRLEYSAPDYDTFADSPLLVIKKHSVKTWDFTSEGASYRAVFYGNETPIYGDSRYQDALKKIIHTENNMMGGPPSPTYMFFFDVNGTGGGLEHLNSTRIALPANISIKSFATFVAHEFFHQWNVKRIRPKPLGPFDYINPPRTHNLWFAEGVTEYYAWMSVYRAGLISRQDLLRHFARAIASLEQNPASSKITADEASWKVWEGSNSEGFGGLSYYQKGELIGLCLDLQIRHKTHEGSSLDELMRVLNLQCNPPALGYDEDDILKTLNHLTKTDLTPLYNRLARSTSPMPFSECLALVGLNTNCLQLDRPTADQLNEQNEWLK